MSRFPDRSRLAVLHRLIQQLPGGDQLLQHAFEPGAVGLADPAGGDRRGIEPLYGAVLFMFEEAEIDAVVGALVILVLGLGLSTVDRIAVFLGKAQLEPSSPLRRTMPRPRQSDSPCTALMPCSFRMRCTPRMV